MMIIAEVLSSQGRFCYTNMPGSLRLEHDILSTRFLPNDTNHGGCCIMVSADAMRCNGRGVGNGGIEELSVDGSGIVICMFMILDPERSSSLL